MKEAVLELNASNDRQGSERVFTRSVSTGKNGDSCCCCCCLCRGIDVVRNKIKMFAQQKVTLPKGRHKIIILDEADR